MAYMTYKNIREAQEKLWPAIRDSIERVRTSREATKNDPLASKAAQARARVPWNRAVANEAIWAVAKADLMNCPEQAAVLTAAKDWARSWDKASGPPDKTDALEDVDLYAAVQALALAEVAAGLNGAAETSGL